MENLSQRQRDILSWIEDQGFATIEALAAHFSVSMQTVRREIIRLDATGHLQRFHGGAGLPERRVRLGYAGKSALATAAKARLAALVATRLRPGSSVFLDVGTTAEAVAKALAERHDLTIVTNSLNCARPFQTGDQRLVVLGGERRGADGSLVGPATLAAMAALAVDVAVIGCSGIDGDGAVTDFDPDKIAVKRAAMARAGQAWLVADASKFLRRATASIGTLPDFSLLVTDQPQPVAIAAALGTCQSLVAS